MGLKDGLNKVFYKAGRAYGKVTTYPQKIKNEYDSARIQAQYDLPASEVERVKRVEKKLDEKEARLNQADYMNQLKQRERLLQTREYETNLNIREQKLKDKQDRLNSQQRRQSMNRGGSSLFDGTGLSTGSIFDKPKPVIVAMPAKKQKRQVKRRGRR